MSCNCKNNPIKELREKPKVSNKILNYIINFIIYLIALSIASVIVLPFLTIVLFKNIVLGNTELSFSPRLLKLFKSQQLKRVEDKEDDDDGDEEDDDDDEYVDIFENVELLDNNVVSK